MESDEQPEEFVANGGRSGRVLVELMQAEATAIAGGHARLAVLIAELHASASMAGRESPSSAKALTRQQLVAFELRAALRLTSRQASDAVRATPRHR